MSNISEALDAPLRPASEVEVSPALGASSSLINLHRVRVLVAIASFGEKNLEFLRKIIHDYRSMAMDAHLVVNSEAPKNLDADFAANYPLLALVRSPPPMQNARAYLEFP